jgi:cytochrome c oxidase subunit 3/cytochrome o ubiquinol oxidase subunit 3
VQHAVSPIPPLGQPAPGDHDYSVTGIHSKKLGMWLFLASECLFFGALISSYLLYRSRGAEGSRPHDVYDIPYTSVSSFVLLTSSLTMVLALAAIQQRDERRMRIWLVVTAALGMIFIGGQVYEFTVFTHEGLNLSSSVAASSFFVLTGFHGVHVTVGIIWLLSLVGFSLRGEMPPERALEIEIAGLYWHFVDVVWIVIFTIVYLVPQ